MAAPMAPASSAISKGVTRPSLEKAGKAFENLGKILQGETGLMSREELKSTIADLKEIGDEYFIGGLPVARTSGTGA